MDKQYPILVGILIVAIVVLFVLSSIQTYEYIPYCGDTKCESGETAEDCPADCAEDDGGTYCFVSTDCRSGVCNFIKQSYAECAAVYCEEGDEALGRDGKVKFECREGEWVGVDGRQTCKDNPYCDLQLPCEGLDEIRVLRSDQYSGKDCVESMAQMILPTVCVECGDGICSEDESECNCPEDCEEATIIVDYSCRADSDCVSTCGEGCVNDDWAEDYEDTCVNVRAWDCTCVDNICNTDGSPPKGFSKKGTLPDKDLCDYIETGWVCSTDEENCDDDWRCGGIFDSLGAECGAQGGLWTCYGFCSASYGHYCYFPYEDTGENCDSSEDCQGLCIVGDEDLGAEGGGQYQLVGTRCDDCQGTCAEYPLSVCDWGWYEIEDGVIVDMGDALCD